MLVFPSIRGIRRIFATSFSHITMNLQTEQLIKDIQAGIQEKKGHDIVIADFTGLEDTICKAFVICTGNSPSHVQALAESIGEFARKGTGAKPTAVDGMRNAQWVAMDYTDVIVHIFLPELREFYDLEHLWADAEITEVPDLD